MKINESPMCTFCNSENETLIHLFWHCPIVKKFWEDIWSNCLKDVRDIDELSVHFGNFENENNIINFFIFHAKNFIYCCKQKDLIPDAMTFCYKIKFIVEVEVTILKKQNNMHMLNKYISFFTFL